MATQKLSRLSPYNITDDLARADLYREIRNGNSTWPEREIRLDETLTPELVSFRHYGTDELKWVVLISAGLDNMRESLEAGTTIKLPPITWIRERIRFYSGADDLDAAGEE